VVENSSIAHVAVPRRRHLEVTPLLVAGPLSILLTVVAEVATTATEKKTAATGAVTSAKVIAGMIVVIDAEMMVEVIDAGLTMAAALIEPLLLMWTPTVRFAPSMAILLASVGGATPMTRKRMIVIVTRELILPHMVLIQTGTLTQGQLITSLAS
jgi:hypothetical protein